MPVAQLILALLSAAPQAITEIQAVYNAVKGDLSETDQIAIDNALTQAQAADTAATAAADAALDQAAGR